MKLYYQDKLKAIVDKRYEQARADVMSGLIEKLPPIIKFRNDVVRELFVAEPDEVREEVAAFVMKRKKQGQDFDSGDEGDEKSSDAVNAQAEAYLK